MMVIMVGVMMMTVVIMIVMMIKNHENRMENMEKSIDKDQEELKINIQR